MESIKYGTLLWKLDIKMPAKPIMTVDLANGYFCLTYRSMSITERLAINFQVPDLSQLQDAYGYLMLFVDHLNAAK